jgi:hypothetical protein
VEDTVVVAITKYKKILRTSAIFIMVGSPKIFEPDCKSPEQIKLANPYCRFIGLVETCKSSN